MKRYVDVKIVNFEGNEVEYSMSLGTREIIFFEREFKSMSGDNNATLFNSLHLLEQGDLTFIIALVCSTLHEKNNGVINPQPIGFDKFDAEYNLFSNIDAIMKGLEVVMQDLQIKNRGSNKGK